MPNLSKLATEKRNPNTMHLDALPVSQIVQLMNQEDWNVVKAVEQAQEQITRLCTQAAKSIENGGRIIYMGAGTSGRLGLLDAVECPPTFGVDYNTVIGLIAGGKDAFVQAQEGAEDRAEDGVSDLQALNPTPNDLVIGLAASGRTPYILGAMEFCRQKGIPTGCIVCSDHSPAQELADCPVVLLCGPEVLTGSTRLKAGTAEKMVLNMVSTISMIMNGKVFENLMVDMKQSNEKLAARAENIVMMSTDCSREQARSAIDAANGSCKQAIVMLLLDLTPDQAKEALAQNKGSVRKVLQTCPNGN